MTSSGSVAGNHEPSQSDLIEAVSGLQGDRDRSLGDKTRRVVLASAGVIQEQQVGRKKIRAWAIAATLVVFFIVAPPIWWLVENLIEEQHLTSTFGEIAIWGFFSITALRGAAGLAGWLRRRS